jgi:hypothetical protein
MGYSTGIALRSLPVFDTSRKKTLLCMRNEVNKKYDLRDYSVGITD